MPDVFTRCSEFEGLEPVSAITERPLESSSAAASATDALEDPVVFSNFFNVRYLVACQFSLLFGEYFCNVNFKF